MAGERSGTRKSKRVAAMETKKPRKSPKTISLSDLPKKSGQNNKRPKAAKKSVSEPKHPTYFQMVVEAIVILKERAGSSRQAIAKFISQRYRNDLPENFRRLMNNQLRALTAKGKLVQVRGSFKLPEEVKNSKEVKEVKMLAAHVTAGEPKKAEKKKVEVPKAKRAKPAAKAKGKAKAPVAAKKKKSEATPRKKITVKTEVLSTISGKQKAEVAGSNLSTGTRKSGRVAKPVAAGPTTPAKRKGRN